MSDVMEIVQNEDGRRGVFIYTTMLTSDGRKLL